MKICRPKLGFLTTFAYPLVALDVLIETTNRPIQTITRLSSLKQTRLNGQHDTPLGRISDTPYIERLRPYNRVRAIGKARLEGAERWRLRKVEGRWKGHFSQAGITNDI